MYRIRVPNAWKLSLFPKEESLKDTTRPLCTFVIEEKEGKINIAIHNFPSLRLDDRIPPGAQIARWQRQFDIINPLCQRTISQSFSGFQGSLYEGRGSINGIDTTILGWAMQMGTDHYRVLSRPRFPRQMRADVTIKASGPSALMTKYRQALIASARSFELIEEIPAE